MIMQDVRRALRLFRMEPAFATAAVLTLALGIGANTALFAVVEAVLLRPLPVDGADGLVIVRHLDRNTGLTKDHLALGDVIDLRDRTQTLEPLAPYGGYQGTLFGEDEPMRVEGLGVTPELLSALRVEPAMGRLIGADDARQGAPPVVMISHELWQTRFGSDPNIIGRGIQLGQHAAPGGGRDRARLSFPPELTHARDHALRVAGDAARTTQDRMDQRPRPPASRIDRRAACAPSWRRSRRSSSAPIPTRIAARCTFRSPCATRWWATPSARCWCCSRRWPSCC